MRCFEDLGAVNRFRRKAWRFQETFATPLKELGPFVGEIVGALREVKSATVTIEQVVFEPTNLMALVCGACGRVAIRGGWSVEASGRSEVECVLKAALGDWVDFVLVPVPGTFVIYADHDEYMTVFSMRKMGLTEVVKRLTEKGFRRVDGYRRIL